MVRHHSCHGCSVIVTPIHATFDPINHTDNNSANFSRGINLLNGCEKIIKVSTVQLLFVRRKWILAAGREPSMGPELSHCTSYAHIIILYRHTIDSKTRMVPINLKVNLIFRVNCHVIFVLIMTVSDQDS